MSRVRPLPRFPYDPLMNLAVPPATAEKPPLCGHLLIVDDEPLVRTYLSRTLRAAGHQVTTAADGTAALASYQQHRFDIIVSDITMPTMDGIDFLRAIRERDREISVVLLTGNPTLLTAQRAVEYSAFRYLTKPVPDLELHAVIQEALALQHDNRARRLAHFSDSAQDALREIRAGKETILDQTLSSLWMAFQAIVKVSDRQVFAFEALMRSRVDALPNPGAILSSAEELGKLDAVGRRVRFLMGAKATQRHEHTFFINLHSNDLLDESLYEPSSPLSQVASRVVLEITERASLDRIDDPRKCATRLRALGYRLALDDLGSGYSGLASFAELAPEFAKIDISLVRDIEKSPVKQRLVRAIVSLCKESGTLIVAEGVETAAERDALAELGCDLLQGFLFGRPDPELGFRGW